MRLPATAVIVGLGNPGSKYAYNRHNVGFMVLDRLAARLEVDFVRHPGRWAAGCNEQVCLVKPLTYMNRSGEALVAWAADRGLPLAGVPEPEPEVGPEAEVEPVTGGVRPLVVCDDLALPLGSVRLRGRGSSGGQNGLASVITELGGSEFPRLRLGIAPLAGEVPPAMWPDFVLADFSPEEIEAAGEMIEHAVDALVCWLAEGLETTISRFNRRVRRAE